MIKTKRFIDYEQDLTTTKENKELYGEVFTSFSLIEDILNQIPLPNFSNTNKRWLDIGAGTGYFSIYLYYKLFENLRNEFLTDEQCKTHIITNMIYMVEIQDANVAKLREIFGEDANIISDDYLEYTTSSSDEFRPDFIIGNPPFNSNGTKKVPSNNHSKKQCDGKTVWTDFIRKSVSILKNDTGLLCVIIPSIWLKPDKVNMYQYLTRYKIANLHCFSNTESNQLFQGNGQTPCCYFCLQKTETDNQINIFDKSMNKYVDYKLEPSKPIPVFAQSIIKKLQPYLSYGLIPIIKTNMPPSKTQFSSKQTPEFGYPNVTTCVLNGNAPELVVNYSDKPCGYHGHPKLILAHKMYGFPYLDAEGLYGVSNRDNYVILEHGLNLARLKQIQRFLSTKTALYLYEATRYRMKYLEKYIFELIPDITLLPDFPNPIDDASIGAYFKFDEREKLAIQALHKHDYAFFGGL